MSDSPHFKASRVIIGSLAIIGVFGAVLWRGGFPVLPERALLTRVPNVVILLYVLNWSVVLLIRCVRWRVLLTPVAHVPWWKALRVAMIGFGALCVLPLRLGEAVRPTLIRRGTTVGWWEAVGTVGAERILDGLFLSGSLALALYSTTWLSPLPDHLGHLPVPVTLVPVATTIALVTFGSLFIALGLFYFAREFTQRLIARTVGRISNRVSSWLITVIARTASGLDFLPRWRVFVPFIVLTSAYWLLNGLSLMWLMRGCGLSGITLGQAWVAMGVLGLGVVIPNAPGYFGAYQLSLFAGLAMYFSADRILASGAVFVFYSYVVQLAVTITYALIAWVVELWETSKLSPRL